MSSDFDVIVIGSGPGGYIAAIKAAQLGFKTACVELRDTLGGTCLNVGCIPSKALLQSSEAYAHAKSEGAELGIKYTKLAFDLRKMQERKSKIVSGMTVGVAGLFKKNKVKSLEGIGSFVSPGVIEVTKGNQKEQYSYKHCIIATGSAPIELPFAPFDEVNVVSSTGALQFDKVPGHLVVVGGGVIGLELGSVWARLGAKVTVVEALDNIMGNADRDVVKLMVRLLKKHEGMEFHTGTMLKSIDKKGKKLIVGCEKKSETFEIEADKVLVSVGRRAYTDALGLERVGISPEKNGKILVDNKFKTVAEGIYAIGDVIEGPMLAHKAEEEAVACIENIAGIPGHVNYDAIPSVVYTSPEVATVGLTAEECKLKGIDAKIGKFPFTANGRAQCMGSTDGFVKVISDKKTDRLLGVHVVGPSASELIGEVALAFEYSASSEDVARSVHAHPTLSEAIKEACLDTDKMALNI